MNVIARGRTAGIVAFAQRIVSKRVEDLSPKACFLLCVCGIAVILAAWRRNLVSLEGVHDFTGFLIGARLLGSPQLYDVAANLALQKAITGYMLPGVIFVRLPFWAFVMKPFTLVDYRLALTIWKLLMMGALVAFPFAFPLQAKRYISLALCWSLPLANALATSNDAPLILLFLALSLLAWNRGRPVLAGLALGLCLAKVHFLVFLPLLLLRRRYWHVWAGFSIPATLGILINFLVQPDWISLYWQALHMPQESMNSTPG